MKKWNILGQLDTPDQLIPLLLKNRGVEIEEEKNTFLSPSLTSVTVESVGINVAELVKAIERVKSAQATQEQVIVFGDYDVDGICGAAIIWESLHKLGINILPYIPHRLEEGYGLSVKGIKKLLEQHQKIGLIITVDNGIVANEAVAFAREQGIDVIITDHHVEHTGESHALPDAYAIIHTTKLCGAAVGWLFSQEVIRAFGEKETGIDRTYHLELVALATVADLVPLKGANRILLKYGLECLCKTTRVGLLSLCKEATLDPAKIGVYEIGHVIAPRLNAMGRMEYAMESLRLLCTSNSVRAQELAQVLNKTNKQRQLLTEELWLHAKEKMKGTKKKLLFLYDEVYQQGVIGLVAGKLVEEFYKPAIVLAKGEVLSKASARSVQGFNIIEFIRSASELLVDAGGHPMAAGFTVETAKLQELQDTLEKAAERLLTEDILTRSLRIDCEIPFSTITKDMYKQLLVLAPFGMGNPEPTFVSKNVTVEQIRFVGQNNKHVKFSLSQVLEGIPAKSTIEAIAFGMGEKAKEIKRGDIVDVAYTISEETWNGNSKLQLKVKDIKKH